MKICENLGKSVKIYENLRKSVEIYGFVGLMWDHKQQIHIFPRCFQIPGSPKYSNRTKDPSRGGVWEGVGGG